ncbi:MAG: DUF58 domain-containing protein [Candidatus Marinimicrobia bacterium]|jgi:uncharacterized protein (DUF58 family)|nr:DUF58 domain-containing protein [Candidatus Neomarinimicrobiota bacterium]MBO69973.1 DUF58 domain-containing protein [Candidatus Neomarinimicrobiota bacterium]|tara:strand:+ start:259 stop:1134 length:876 start_codon:yes stop_codon:yes gene_type:complete
MIPKKILQKVKHIEIRTKGLVNDLFGGEYHSAFKGQGMTFSEVREYYPGDDIRMIDWNVTARNNAPYVKIFEEERELTVYILVDISSSGSFGTIDQLKSEMAAEIAAVLGFSAIKNQDKVGLILFSSEVEKFIAPQKNKSHILRLIREVLFYKSQKKGTSIQSALDYLMNVSKRKSVVFLISDFLDSKYWKSLKLVNKKHDLIGIRISDPAEKSIPNIGLFKGYDPESGDEFWIDTSSNKERKLLRRSISEKWDDFDKKCKKNKFSLLTVSTSEDYVEPIMNFFHRRERRS